MKTRNKPKGLSDSFSLNKHAANIPSAQSGKFTILILLLLTIASTLVNSSLFVYQTLASYFLFTVLSLSLLLYLGVGLIWNKIWRFRISMLVLLFVSWGIYIILHETFIKDSDNLRFAYLIIAILFYISLCQLFLNKTFSFYWLYIGITGIAFFEAITCIAQYFGAISSFNGYFKVTGTQVNPNITAMFLAMAIPAHISIPSSNKGRRMSFVFWIKLFIGFCIAVSLIMLKCRTAFIGATISIIVTYSIRFRVTRYLFDKQYRLTSIALFIIVMGLTIPFVSSTYHSKQASADGRKTIWKISMQMIAERPLFGYGYGMFERNYNLHQAAYFEQGGATRQETANASFVRMAYNELIEIAVEGGFAGVFLFLGIIIVLLIYGGKRYTNAERSPETKQTTLQYTVAFSGIVAFVVMSFVNFTVQAIPVMCLFIVYAGILTSKFDHSPEEIKNSSSIFFKTYKLNKSFTRVSGAILVISAFWLVSFEVIYGTGQLQLKQAVNLNRSGNPLLAEKLLSPLDTRLRKSGSYLYERGKILMALENYPLALDKLTKATFFMSDPDLYLDIGKCRDSLKQNEDAKKAFQLASYIEPTRFVPKYRLMELYRQTGDTVNALQVAHSILQLKPKVPSKEVTFYKNKAKVMVLELERSKILASRQLKLSLTQSKTGYNKERSNGYFPAKKRPIIINNFLNRQP